MRPENGIWIFVGENARFPSGIFSEFKKAELWIQKHKLSGILNIMPINEGVFDWAIKNDALTLKSEKIPEKLKDPNFIASCLPASLDHYHYSNGKSV